MRLLILMLLLVCSWLLSCQNEAEKKFLIGFSQCCSDPWREVMEGEMYRELSFHPELDFALKVADDDSQIQIQQIRELLAMGIDLLLVAPNESEPLTAIIDSIYRAGIAVILIDRKTESAQYNAYVGADNYEIGKTAGNYIANKLQGKGKVIEIQMAMSISPAVERSNGFAEALAAFPELAVIAQTDIGWQLENIKQQVPSILLSHPEADVIYAHTDLLAQKTYELTIELGLPHDMIFIGVDGIPGPGNGIQAVEDGILDASFLYPTGGTEAIRLALLILNKLPYKRQNLLQTTVIDASNAKILHAQMNKVASLQESIDRQIKRIDELYTVFRDQRTQIIFLGITLILALVLGGFLYRSLEEKKRINADLETKNKEVLAQQKQLVDMSEEIQRITTAKVNFFTNISHEFRTPLTLILGFAEDLIPIEVLSQNMKQSVRLIGENAVRLLRLVNQLMDFRKIESAKMELKASENDLIEFIRNAMKSYQRVAQKRDLDFKLLTRHEKMMVWFDTNMIDKVFFNLLSNAFKFTPEGGKIHIVVQKDTLENLAIIKFEDSGPGMSAADLPHVFEPFFQGESAYAQGTGLGLPLSRTLVELHQGKISLSSRQGKGSRFRVSLPLGNNHLEAAQMVLGEHSNVLALEQLFSNLEDEPEMQIGPQQAPEHKLLIVEDSAELQFFLHKKLSSSFGIMSTTDGSDGLTMAYETLPDLILCDIMLPGTNGLDIVRNLKNDVRTSHIPIILISAHSSIEQQIEGTKAGADAYFTKPFNLSYLREKIKNLLYNRRLLKDSFSQEILTFSSHPDLSQIDQDFLQRFNNYLKANFTRQDFQVTDLCEEMHLSRSQLYRKVKALLGQSISEIIQELRLKHARDLLHEADLSIADVAYQVGYSSPDYFSTVFKTQFDCSPSQYRRELTK